mgnify:CR=1 FL=1
MTEVASESEDSKHFHRNSFLFFEFVRTFVAGKSSRSRASIVIIKLSAWASTNANYVYKNSKLHGIWLDAWNPSQSQCEWDCWTKVTCYLNNKAKLSKGALYSKKKAEHVECHQSLFEQNVCSLFRIAFKLLQIFLLFLNLANKIPRSKSFL